MEKLPVYGLPAAVQNYIANISETFSCPSEFVTAAALFAASSVIGNRVKVYDGRYTNPLMLWLVNVGRSGTNKTAPVKRVISYLKTINEQWFRQYTHDMADFRRNKNASEADRPVCRQLFVSDATDEARNQVLANNPRGVACHMPEIGGFFDDLQRYSKGGSVPRLLRLYDGDSITLNRKLDPEPVYIANPFMSILGDIQPSLMGETFGDKSFVNAGLTQRFLFCYFDQVQCAEFNNLEPDYNLQAQWDLILKSLNGEYNGVDILLKLRPEAVEVYGRYYNSLQADKPEADDYESSVLSKCQIQVLRLAGVVHMLNAAAYNTGCDIYISEAEMAYAVECMKYFRYSAERVRQAIEAASTPNITNKELIRTITSRFEVRSKSDLARVIGVTPGYISQVLASA